MNRIVIGACFSVAVIGSCSHGSAQYTARQASHEPAAVETRPFVRPAPQQGVKSDSQGSLSLPQPRREEAQQFSGGLDSTGRVIMSLSVVLGMFFLIAWLGRKRIQGTRDVPADVVEVLGSLSLGPRESARLIRVGSKLLLVASTPHGLTTLTEVTDSDEVEELTRQCYDDDRRWRQEAA